MDNNEIINELLKEFIDCRIHIKAMISDLENIREKIDKIFPDSIDKRYVRLFEEKMKAVTSLFNTLLDMRKEISKNVQVEIELRRKVGSSDEELLLEDIVNIRKIVKKVEDLKKQKTKIESSDKIEKQEIVNE